MTSSLKIQSLVFGLFFTSIACSSTSPSSQWVDPDHSPRALDRVVDEPLQDSPDPLELPKIDGEDFHRECGDPNCLSHQSPAPIPLAPVQAELLSLDRPLDGEWDIAWQEEPDSLTELEQVAPEQPEVEESPRSFWQRIDWGDVGKFTAVTVLVGAAITVDVMLIVSSEGKSGAPCTELVLTILKG